MLIRPVEPADASEIVKLVDAAAGSLWTEDYVRWKYFDNPIGVNYTFVAETDGQLVGLHANVPYQIQIGSQVVLGTQTGDMMVNRNMRRDGISSRMVSASHEKMDTSAPPAKPDRGGRLGQMIRASHDDMDASQVVLAYGLPNEKSYPVLVKRLDFEFLGWIPRYVKPLNTPGMARTAGRRGISSLAYRALLSSPRFLFLPARILTRAVPITVERAERFDDSFDAIWQRVSPSLAVAVVRDRQYLTWRYTNHPQRQYVTFLARRGDDPVGYVILNQRSEPGGITGIVAEFFFVEGEASAGYLLLQRATEWAQSVQCDQLQCWMLPQHKDYRQVLRRAGFVYWPWRFAPGILRYKTAFIVRSPAGDKYQPTPLSLDNWFLSMGDQDHF